jgi:hypothetical protein
MQGKRRARTAVTPLPIRNRMYGRVAFHQTVQRPRARLKGRGMRAVIPHSCSPQMGCSSGHRRFGARNDWWPDGWAFSRPASAVCYPPLRVQQPSLHTQHSEAAQLETLPYQP